MQELGCWKAIGFLLVGACALGPLACGGDDEGSGGAGGGNGGSGGSGASTTGGSGGTGASATGGSGGIDCSNVGCAMAPMCATGCTAPCGCCGCPENEKVVVDGGWLVCTNGCYDFTDAGGSDASADAGGG